MDHFFKQLIEKSAQNQDIVWSGEPWYCRNQLKHYPACSKGTTNISVHSFVWILDNERKALPAYLEDLFEDREGQKTVLLRPFLLADDIEPLVPDLKPESREVFITPTQLEISAGHIVGPAEILTPDHFRQHQSAEGFISHREFVNNGVRPFALGRLRGYARQPAVLDLKKKRTEESVIGHGIPVSGGLYDTVKWRARGETSRQRSEVEVGQEVKNRAFPEAGDTVEVLSEDRGTRGCWFRFKVLRSKPKRFKVEQCDVNGPDKLKKWVSKAKVANPDRLDMRCGGRHTIRPCPHRDPSDLVTELGSAVDVWLSHGWWEGVVTGFDTSGKPNIQVYFPGENMVLFVERKNVRASKDWVDEQWVGLKRKPDILAFLNSYLNPPPEAQVPLVSNPNSSDDNKSKLPSSSDSKRKKRKRDENVDDSKSKLPSSSASKRKKRNCEERAVILALDTIKYFSQDSRQQ